MPDETLAKLNAQATRITWMAAMGFALVMIVALFMMLLTMWNTYRLGQTSTDLRAVAVETHDALCALYNKEVQANVEAEDFLKENPSGVTSPSGEIIISTELIQRGVDSRAETIIALQIAGLDCTGEVIT